MPLTIHSVTTFEVIALQQIARQTFKAAFEEQNTEEDIQVYLAENLGLEKLLTEIDTPGSEFYLAYFDQDLIGYLKLNFGEAQTDLQDPKSMEIERIYVLPRYYGKQAGLQLLEFALQRALKSKMEAVWLGVWEYNARAIRFYEKNGFREFARHSFTLGSDNQTDILMRKEFI